MPYKSILVHVDETPRSAARLDAAFELGQAFGAHVTGLALVPEIVVPPMVEVAYGAKLAAAHTQALREALDPVKAGFAERARRAGVSSSEWREGNGDVVATAALHARYADLFVIGQSDPEDERTRPVPGFQESVILAAGRPVLVMPYAGTFTRVGTKALVAWNASRESTRAVTDALPLLQRADKVTVMVVRPRADARAHGEVPGADIAAYLARHGVKVEVMAEEGEGIDVGDLILSRVADLGSDLVVMGAYSHSRLREWILGGATRTMLESMTVPVLMAH